MAKRPKQANFVSLNVRLPPELHKKLVTAAGLASSLNSEIIRRLEAGFALDTLETMHPEDAKRVLAMLMERVERIEKRLPEKKRKGEAS
jgi:hypothetical protein